LKKFFSTNPAIMLRYLQDQGIEADPENLPEEVWFDPDDARPTFQSLLKKLDEEPGPVQSVEKVRADLRAMFNAIEQAAANGERFHIGTGMPDLSGREPEHLR
jgi:hypothetical protein